VDFPLPQGEREIKERKVIIGNIFERYPIDKADAL